ncbi:Flp family type IVb pilin [Planctomycetota bacterium]
MLKKMIKRFIKDERGLEGSEYALLLALICVAIITAVGLLASAIADRFNNTADTINNP